MQILIVVGARPNFMKVGPIIAAIQKHNATVAAQASEGESIDVCLVHTGQHYDDAMSRSFFTDLDLPEPDVHLNVGSASHAVQTAEIMKKFEEVLLAKKPDYVFVVGDVNSTVACALVTAKISFDAAGTRPRIVHVESGLRSFDRQMPEEINRVLTDHISDVLFVTEESGLRNLENEGVSPDKMHFVGNTMIDSLLAFKEKAERSTILEDFGLRTRRAMDGSAVRDSEVTPYGLLTLHRPSNVDDAETFLNIIGGLEELASACPIIFPAHPRTQRRINEFGFKFVGGMDNLRNAGEPKISNIPCPGIILAPPLGYLDFLCLMKHSTIVVTDSGGIQEETTCLGIPCVTVRENTERPVTVESGTNVIAGTKKATVRAAIREQLAKASNKNVPAKWDGHAAARMMDVVLRTDAARKMLNSQAVGA
jgi:UDP-N-acetylglucosamine 2-epimerase (non-hydrolysing)